MSTDLKIYDKIRALAGNYKIMHNDVGWTSVLRDDEILRGQVITLPHDYSGDYLTIESLEDGNVVTFTRGNNAVYNTFYYSTDGTTWTSADDTTSWNLDEDEKVMLKAAADRWATSGNDETSWHFSSTKTLNAYGNIMSLLFGDNFAGHTTFKGYEYVFANLFSGCSGLVDASNLILPATTLIGYCYANMFRNCTSLTTAPELPATTAKHSCYYYMFSGCSSLTSAPELPATTIAGSCYWGMFFSCASLTTAPSILPATTLDLFCYASMFYGCTSLTTAPELPATNLNGYCYTYMFCGCTSLTSITCLATDIDSAAIENWVSGVAASGIFYKNASMSSWTTGVSGIPSGWTVQNA